MNSTSEPLVTRATVAYLRACNSAGTIADQPGSESRVTDINGRTYVTVANSVRVLAVYRVKPDGVLRRLVRYPRQLNTGVAA